MIRQRVTRHGVIFPLPPSSQLPGCTMDRELVGVVKQGPVSKWLAQNKEWDRRFASAKKKTQKKFIQDLIIGYEGFGEGELPPPSALAGRRLKGDDEVLGTKKRVKSLGLAMWSGWGSKHDKMTMDREEKADKEGDPIETTVPTAEEGQGARPYGDIKRQTTLPPTSPTSKPKLRSRRVSVRDERQTGGHDGDHDNTTVNEHLAGTGEEESGEESSSQAVAPGYAHTPEVGIGCTGKRPYVDGIAVPFSIRKREAETASMMTLTSNMSQGQGPLSPEILQLKGALSHTSATASSSKYSSEVERDETRYSDVNGDHDDHAGRDVVPAHVVNGVAPTLETPAAVGRPGLETYTTAAENLPQSKGSYFAAGVE